MALTTAAGYKSWAGIGVTTYDTPIGVALTQAEKLVAEVLDRRLEDGGSDATEYYDGHGTSNVQLRSWPITSITSVSYLSGVSAGVPSYTAFDSGSYWFDANSGLLSRWTAFDVFPDTVDRAGRAVWPEGNKILKVVYRAGYTSANVPADLAECIYEVISRIMHGREGSRADKESTDEALRVLILDRAGHYRKVGL